MADRFDEILNEMRSDRAERRAERDREHADREREHAERERERAERERERIEWSAKMDRRLDQTDEMLRFVGELNRRSEIVFQDVIRELREMRGETRANTETTKAHTRAIFALIDRLEGGGGIAPAT